MSIKIVDGDLIEMALQGRFDVIAHGCNCFCTMGAGIAKSIRTAFPEAYAVDCLTKEGDKAKLGTITIGTRPMDRWYKTLFHVVNCYTQYWYCGQAPLVDYDAVRSCMKLLKEYFAGSSYGLPMIGAGLAGGDWDVISYIIEEELKDEEVIIVRYEPGER